MIKDGIMRRIILMLLVTVICAAVFFGAVLTYYKLQSNQIENSLYGYEQAYVAAYLYPYTLENYENEAVEQLQNCYLYLTEDMQQTIEPQLIEAAGLISSGAASIEKYEVIVKDIDIDYRYGGVRATVKVYIDYQGYGAFVGQNSEQNVEYTGVMTRTVQMRREADRWKIASEKTVYE